MNYKALKDSVIFAVDDNTETLEILVQYLSDFNINIVPVRSGEKLFNLIKKRIPDLILLDIMMPGGIDGYETCRRLKKDINTANIPVIFMSALTDSFDKTNAFNSGGVDYITKPIEAEELLSRINIHLSLSRLQKELYEINSKLEEKIQTRTEELRQTNIKLKEEIKKRIKINDELRESNKKAEDLYQVKTLFFSNMSHELRTPCNGITCSAELLVDLLPDSDEKDLAKVIHNSSTRLTETLNKILSISKLESDKVGITKNEVNISEIINDVYNQFYSLSQKKNLELTKKTQNNVLVIQTDRKIIREILINLVHNAITYSNEGGINISAKIADVSDKTLLVIKVLDTGIGIAEENQELIWEPFRQVSEGTNKAFQGTGLGLSITKKYVQLLGGEISIESKVGVGSTFKVEIPIEPVLHSVYN